MSIFQNLGSKLQSSPIFRSGIHYCDSPMNSEIVKVRNGSPFSSIIMQSSIQSIPSGHREFISDTAFDYYGKRLVSASANGHLRVWNEVDGEFKLQTEIEAYSSLISRVDWAHPVFGQLFAACFHNDTVVIYQECIDCNKHKEWKERCQIPTSNTSPLDIAFSPSFFGLNLVLAYCFFFLRQFAIKTDLCRFTVQRTPFSFETGNVTPGSIRTRRSTAFPGASPGTSR